MPIRKYIGTRVNSQKTKKRIRSVARKTPSIPVSSERKKSIKPLTRSWTALQVDRIATGVSSAVSRTIISPSPSTPKLRLISTSDPPSAQGTLKASCRFGLAGLNWASIHREMPKVASEVSSATQRMAVFPSGLSRAMMVKPTIGKNVSKTRGLIIASPHGPEGQVSQDSDHAEQNHQRVGADEAGLDQAQALRGGAGKVAKAVDHAVDEPLVECIG